MRKLKKIAPFFLFIFICATVSAQRAFSIASDLGLQKNFRKDQEYIAFGNTTKFLFHLTPKEGFYTWLSFYSRGHFKHPLTAVAKSPATIPQTINYVNKAKMGLKQFSLGYHRYFKGTPYNDDGWNIYGYAGFGVVFGRVENAQSIHIDTANYTTPIRNGRGNFKRLSIDAGFGFEKYLMSDFYFYAEGRVWIPTTDYPSKYIFINTDAPIVGMLCVGIRIVF